jgi:hypothetical protein
MAQVCSIQIATKSTKRQKDRSTFDVDFSARIFKLPFERPCLHGSIVPSASRHFDRCSTFFKAQSWCYSVYERFVIAESLAGSLARDLARPFLETTKRWTITARQSTCAARSSLPSTFGYLWAALLERHGDALFIRARIYHRRPRRR